MDLPDPDRPRASSRLTVSRAPFPSLGSPVSRDETRDMKTILLTIAAQGFAVAPALAHECPLLHKQVTDAADYRLDDAAYKGKMLAAEGDTLHKAGKHDESVAKYDEAASAMGLTLVHKPK
jgi:hypothetical protein